MPTIRTNLSPRPLSNVRWLTANAWSPDVGVLQELLHHFVGIRRPEAIQPAFDVLLGLVDETLPIELPDVQAAKEIALGGYRVSARDALHLAVMRRNDIDTVLSFDRDFDRYPGVTRIG